MDDADVALVGVVDDHAQFREVLCEVIERMDGVTVSWECASAIDAFGLLDGQRVDLVVVDLSLPGVNGVEFIRRLAIDRRDVVSIVVSGHTERSLVDDSLRAGAVAFVLKGRPAELRTGIRAALDGHRYLSPGLTTSVEPEP